ncbi:aminoacyl-histidine dipeptidase [Mesonia aestuariivivens]|uniref:Aminoacyl-histidine dipeptidase n=1 Tax=Mesonia aestuariivivens TaxID=2796128 RepID=A0ABS6W054_9FLAO|nr:aminoacyl-histidine dipeptidase [Mesonia aestuariivivens]MBW2961227.1 aminoacyl-histidine dipeptidase [Mesonia aestuariivivens]
MSQEIRNLEPKAVWNKFADLNAVPRPSKKEERVIAFMKDFGEKLGLKTIEDKAGNVIIKKPATAGMEDRAMIVLQSHLDMVHQKNNDTNFDFATQGIDMYIDGDWVRANGTTLGADNGLGAAAAMAVLESTTIVHPAIEALFTIDEETGMTGAKNLDNSVLEGEILLNLDTEEDDEIGIGCAGGVDITAKKTYQEEQVSGEVEALKITVKGLNGGHSGMDIIKGLGNANILMNRVLYNCSQEVDIRIAEVNGGGLRNAIPRESQAIIVVAKDNQAAFQKAFEAIKTAIETEFKSVEANLNITAEVISTPEKVMSKETQVEVLKSLYAAHNGVFRMSPDIEDLVETSNNVAKVSIANGKAEVSCLTRSSVESGKWDLAYSLRSGFELAGFEVEFSGDYPGWAPNPDSAILKVLDELYQKQTGEKANIAACHAGLECGIIGSHYPKMDMISFGPTIRGAHSPDERASISSTQKFWYFFKEVLQNIPKK